ncbi:MAG: SDR family oxidoreductase [Actinomycetota bacterium]
MNGTESPRVLVTGATGYVASRLIPRLIEAEWMVRATSRHPEDIGKRHPEVEAIASDLQDASSLERVMQNIDVAYYLVHSMDSKGFADMDKKAAHNFADAAAAAGVKRIVYLGGLGNQNDKLSQHLRSRHEVGRILAEGAVEVLEFRAAIVIGSGSVAFEMLRHLTERLPAMIAPRWLSTRIQPIGGWDLTNYLVAGATVDLEESRIVEVGGLDALTYKQMILDYAAVRGLKRIIVSVPVLTPRLSSYWVNLVTPVKSSISQPLIEGLRNEVVVDDDSATRIWPEIKPACYKEAVGQALRSQIDFLDSPTDPELKPPPGSLDGLLVDMQRARSGAEEDRLREEIARIGGNARWYPLRWTWWIRARLDDAVGGTGLRWDRPDGPLEPGQRVDWWTVEDTGPDRLLLKAEMKVPGEAWLEFRVVDADGGSELRQTAYFRPRGLLGRLYWWALWPFHISIFGLMAKRLARRAEFGGSGRKYTRQWFSERVGRSGDRGMDRRSGGEMK